MTNEELTQALQALADEFGGEYEEAEDAGDCDYYATIYFLDVRVTLSIFEGVVPLAEAWIIGDDFEVSSGFVSATHVQTILIWLRAKLLQPKCAMREIEFEELLRHLGRTCYDMGCTDTFNKMSRATPDRLAIERGKEIILNTTERLRELAFGGK